MRLKWLLCVGVIAAAPVSAQDADPLAPLDPATVEQEASEPASPAPAVIRQVPVPAPPKVIPKDWRGVLIAINQGEWEAARLGIEGLPNGPLKAYARAELFTAKDSPRVELAPILAVLVEAPELPQAEQLYRMAIARGARNAEAPAIYWPRPTVSLGTAPRRGRTRSEEHTSELQSPC